MGLAAAAERPSGLEIMQERDRRHESRSESTQIRMTLLDRKGRARERRAVVFYKEDAHALGKTLFKFLSPADIRNVGLLTWERDGAEEDDQWLYLPASRRVKRIAGSSKKHQFMGTDLAYEDVRPENLSAHRYERVREEPLAGEPCWVVEAVPSTPKERRDTGYGRRLLWVRQDIYFVVRVEFCNHANALIKIATFDKLKNVKGDAWRSDRSTFERVRRRTKTVTEVTSRELDARLADSLFTQQALQRPPIEP